MERQTEEMRLYFNRVRPMCRELFAMAFAICADYDGAEYALQRVILSGFVGSRRLRSKRGFAEGMRAEMRRVALSQVKKAQDDEWDQYGADPFGEPDSDPLFAGIQLEDADTRRAVMLKYGCGLKNAQVARAMGIGNADALIGPFLRRIKRSLPPSERNHLEAKLREVCRRKLAEDGAEMPDMGALYRNFEAEASASYSPVGHFASRAAAFIAAVVLMAMLGCIAWGVSAIIRPAQIEQPPLMTETLEEQ